MELEVLVAALWNRNYFLRFRFRFLLLKSYGSGSDFWKSYGSGSYFWTFEKLRFRFRPAPYLDHKKQILNFGIFFAFLHNKLFYKEKVYNFNKFIVKCEWNNF